MNTGKILLARPNIFIVKHMKRLVEDTGNVPFAIKHIKEIDAVDPKELKGVVISTSVSSVVGESYFDVLRIVKNEFESIPIFLASLSEADSIRRSFLKRSDTSDLLLQSIDEAHMHPTSSALVIIRKEDLTNPLRYPQTLSLVKKKIA